MSGVPNFLSLLYHFSQYCFLVLYVVGMNHSSPRNPHPTTASGGNDPKNANISPPTEAYVLYCAVVGGPDKKDKYYDLRDDWI